MAGPGFPAPASIPAALGGGSGIDATYSDDPGDSSVQIHQQHHDMLHWIANCIDKDSVPATPVLLAGVVANNQSGTTYTLVQADAGKVIELNNGSAVTLSVPTDAAVAFPVGTVVELWQQGAGQVNVVAVTPATTTIRSPGGRTHIAAQYGSATLRKRAANEWCLEGDLS